MNIQAIWTDELTEQLPKQKYEKIVEFMELLDLLNDNMLAINLNLEGAYEYEDFARWIYSRREPELADVKKELMIRMSKGCHCEDQELEELKSEIGKVREPKYFALNFREEDNCHYAASVGRIYEICRRYLGMESKSEFKADLEFCFPDIFFDKTVSVSLNSLNRKFDEIRKEIVEHLTALNDYKVTFIRQVKEKKGYREIAMEFQRDSGIECSPQGDKKGLKILMREFVNECTGKKETINCELHTKFNRYNIDKDKQDRIYFAPAREGICAGKVILIHIGDHLK